MSAVLTVHPVVVAEVLQVLVLYYIEKIPRQQALLIIQVVTAVEFAEMAGAA